MPKEPRKPIDTLTPTEKAELIKILQIPLCKRTLTQEQRKQRLENIANVRFRNLKKS